MMELIELGNECEIITKGTTPTTLGKSFTTIGVGFLRAQNVINSNVLIDEDILYIDDETHNNELKRSQIFDGDVLLTIAGTIGRTAIVKNINIQLNCNQAVAIIRLGDSKINKEYLCHFIASPNAQEQFFKGMVTATIANLSLAQIRKLKIPLPPLPQQQKIANILDAADALRQNDKVLIAKYDELTQALFLDMFGDPVSNPKGWEKVELKKLLKNANKIGRDFNIKNIQYVDISSIDNSKFMITSTTNYQLEDRPSRAQQILENGDVLLATVRPNLKNIAINIVDGFIASTGFYVCRCNDKINNRFLFEVLKSDSVTNYFVGITAGANYPAVKSSDVSKFLICLPQIELQNQFAERVAVIEEQKAIAQKSLEKSESLFNSLLQKAFKGEL